MGNYFQQNFNSRHNGHKYFCIPDKQTKLRPMSERCRHTIQLALPRRMHAIVIAHSWTERGSSKFLATDIGNF
jgi:hypothetical protein